MTLGATHESKIVRAMENGASTTGDIVAMTGIPSTKVSKRLFLMMRDGRAHQTAGGGSRGMRATYALGAPEGFVPPVPPELTWTDARVEQLRRAVTDGLSAHSAAKIMGMTKNQVLGKASRMDLKFGKNRPVQINRSHKSNAEITARASRPPKAPPVPKAQNGAQNKVAQRVKAATAKPLSLPPLSHASRAATRTDPTPLRCESSVAGVIPLLDLGAHMCKWPIGDPSHDGFGFCGRPSGGVYCDKHHRIAYQPMPPKRIKEPYEGRKVTPAHLGRRAGGFCE